MSKSYVEHFQDCLAASATAIRSNEDLSAATPAASYTPEAVYDTVDLSTGGAITGGDDFTVWYMS